MGVWIIGLNGNVKYRNRFTGNVMDCGTASPDAKLQTIVDWAISQADPGDVVMVRNQQPISILPQPKGVS